MKFTHLKYVKQTYLAHFMDAFSYSCSSFKAGFYFFIHAFCPDLFEFDGSREIDELNSILIYKRRALLGLESG
jgi:hypothetical protein